MSFEQWIAAVGVASGAGLTLAGLITAITNSIIAFRRKDSKPAPEVGIAATPTPDDDIDYRAYVQLEKQLEKAEERAQKAELDRDAWMRRALGIDEDTRPIEPT